jgi:hypothetical protein
MMIARGVESAAVNSGRAAVGLRRLWLGLLLAPGAWVVAELLGYVMAARSCEPPGAGVPLSGSDHPATAHLIIQAAAAIVAATGLILAVGNWRATRQGAPGEPPAPGRAHFMGFTGQIVSALFLFGILLFGFSGFVVDVCRQSR